MIDADEIVRNLWQGSKPPIGPAVAHAGFAVLVLCARDYQPASVYFPKVRVIHAPNDDGQGLHREDLKVAVSAATEVAEAVTAGQKVLVTCMAGINRSGLVVALALHKAYGYSGKTCIDLVRQYRKVEDFKPLQNPYFVEALLRLPGQERIVLPGLTPLLIHPWSVAPR